MERRQLVSWKEISQYLGYAVRTVQRYELSLGLPIHRPAGRGRTSVLAFSDELDFWLRSTPLSAAQSALDGRRLQRIPISAGQGGLRNELSLAEEDLKRAIKEYERCLARYNQLKESLSRVRPSDELKAFAIAG
jgi:hypothetical protein